MDAYSVALRLTLNNQITAGLIGISQMMGRVHGDAVKLKGTLNDIKLLVTAGAVATGAGFMGLNLLSKTLPDAKEYAHQLAQMNIAGMKQAEIARSINAAWALNRTVPTSTAAENLLAIRENRTVFGDTQEAINFLPVSQRLAYILANTKGGDVKGETQALARALDLRNATTSTETATTQADMMMKAIVASGGVLTARDFNQTFKYGRSATLGWSNEFAYTILPSLMQELKTGSGSGAGGGPGNPLMSMYSRVVQGKIAQKDLKTWTDLGLLDPSYVVWNKVGSAKGVRPGGVKGWELYMENPYAWTQTVARPALEAAGYTSDKDKMRMAAAMFGGRTDAAAFQTMLLQSRAIERDKRMIGIAQGMGAYESLMKNDPRAADAALAAQWKNLLAVIGFEILPILVPLTLRLADGLKDLAAWARENRGAVKALVIGFGGLSTILGAGGVLMLFVGGVKALGLTLRVMGVAKLFTLAKGLGAVSTFAPGAAAGLGGLALAIGRLIPLLGGAAALVYTGRDIAGNVAGAGRMAGIMMGGGSRGEKDVAAWEALKGTRLYDPKLHNRSIGRMATERGGSPYIAAGAGQTSAAGGNVFLDGKKVGVIVGNRIGQALGHTSAAGRGDAGATLPGAGAAYAK